MTSIAVSTPIDEAAPRATRLYYLDWLRLLATLGVFLFHITNIFSGIQFEITNGETSPLLFVVASFFYPWGLPLFFLVSGAGSWFALRRRSAAQFTRERTLRLLVPFFTGTLLLGPLQIYLSWRHRSETAVFQGTLLDFVIDRWPGVGPKLIGAAGYHMWFLGFLFLFSLLALPIFVWLKGENGRKFVLNLATFCRHRGAILLFILPLLLLRLGLQPFFPRLQDWADFFSYWAFFVLGFLVFSEERFLQVIRRDWWILLAAGVVSTLGSTTIAVLTPAFNIEAGPRTSWDFLFWAFVVVCSWCWTAVALALGMRYLDHDSKPLRYGQETLLPFFVLHQPVVLAVAYFVVQWPASISIKLLAVVLVAFTITIALCEGIKRVPFLRILFGMKPKKPAEVQVAVA